MKKSIVYFAALIIVIPGLNSCKRGEEDPVSMRSRDSRVTGTWTLKTSEEVTTENSTKITTNTVNGDVQTETTREVWKNSIAGGAKTVLWSKDYENNKRYKSWDGSIHKSETDVSIRLDETTDTKSHTVVISIYKDNTYDATLTDGYNTKKTLASGSDNGVPIVKTDTTDVEEIGNSRVWTDEGEWFWLDAKKDKIIIVAGPLNGYLLRLANDEIIISEFSDTKDDDVEVKKTLINTYNSASGFDLKEGNETVEVKMTQVKTKNQVWQKTDKESDREDVE